MAQPRKSTRKRNVAAIEENQIRISKRPRLSKKDYNATPPIPELPDDILRIIFKNLSTQDRVPLGLVSKRFRSIDHDIGKREFDEIGVFHDYDVNITAGISKLRYLFNVNGKEPISKITPKQFFKNAFTQCFSIYIGGNVKIDKFLNTHSLFKTLHFKELYLQFDSSSNILDVLYRFCSTVLSVGDLKDVTLVWENLKEIKIEDLRVALQSFPEMEKISLEIPDGEIIDNHESKISSFPYFVCDGKTMIHLIKNSNNADLGSVDCTAHEIFEAFEIFCEVKRITKRATFWVLQSIVDELFAIAEQRPRLMVDAPGEKDREFFDPLRGGILYVDDDWKDSISSRREICIYRDIILP